MFVFMIPLFAADESGKSFAASGSRFRCSDAAGVVANPT
jgi:hypothetical protein